jgi:uncharacterized protein (DUF1800 family)
MKGRTSHLYLRYLVALVLSLGTVAGISAQTDTDPNSPMPILLTGAADNRALTRQTVARPVLKRSKGGAAQAVAYEEQIVPAGAFARDSRAVLFLANLDLMEGEGANAFRVYGRDEKDHIFRFPVISIEPTQMMRMNVYELTIQLTDETGFWGEPSGGDIAVYLTWRGLASNEVKFGIDTTGGGIKDSPGVVPMPPEKVDAQLSGGKPSIGRGGKQIVPNYVGYKWSGDRRRFLEQATFGPTAASDERIRRVGLHVWLAEQFAAPYPSLSNPYPNFPLQAANPVTTCDGSGTDDSPPTCFRDSYTQYQPQTWFFREAYYGDAQLRHRVAWALAQIWVTSGVDIQQGQHEVEYFKILANNAFGNYRELMKQETLNPAFGDYLSMSLSTKNNPNENYAREIMQLFTVGLFMLKSDGTPICAHDPCQVGESPLSTYDQNNVNNLTRVLTGWSFCQLSGATCPHLTSGTVNFIDPMILNPAANGNINNNRHDVTAKTMLSYNGAPNVNIPACATTGSTSCAVTTGVNAAQALANIQTYANTSLDQALDNLYNHPNVAPFVCKRLIQQMVTSDPSPAYVGRVAAVFDANRSSPTQMKAVVTAILLDPEARGDNKTDPNFGKLREPVQYATNILRLFNVKGASGNPLSDGSFALTNTRTSPPLVQVFEFSGMAQVPFMSPTVFNFYPPDYVIPNTAVVGPEFALMNTGTAVQRASFVNRMVFTSPAIAVNSPDIPLGTTIDLSDLQALSAADSSGGLLMDDLNNRMMHGTMSASMRSTILTAVTSISATDALGRARQAVYLVATSSQYQVQR